MVCACKTKMEDKFMISMRIRELRKQAKLSQEMMAEKIGVSRQAITKWETFIQAFFRRTNGQGY